MPGEGPSAAASVGTRRGASAGLVLRTVLEHGPVARSTIARLTGLSPASVTGHSGELAAFGLIQEQPDAVRSNGMGRPHMPIDVDTSTHLVCGVHIAVPRTTIALLDLRGRVVAEHCEPHAAADAAQVLSRAAEILTRLLEEDADGRAPLGIGVATGGWVDQRTGQIVEHPLLGWRDVPVRDVLSARTGLTVHVDSHARALLQAEQLFGGAGARESILHLFVGNVVDSAFAVGGRVHSGPRSRAGAIAHLRVPESTERCPCGRVGCLQATVSEQTLIRRAIEQGFIPQPAEYSGPSHHPVLALVEAARSGHSGARQLFVERARHVGRAAALLMDVLNPELVVVVEAGVMTMPHCLNELRNAVRVGSQCQRELEQTVVTTGIPQHAVLATAAGAVMLAALYRDPLRLLVRRRGEPSA